MTLPRTTIVFGVLIGFTLALRLWNLEGTVWFKTDEGNNGYLALQILREHTVLLRGVVAHFGAVTHYVTAGLFALFGVNQFVLRLAPALASVGASLLAIILLRRMAGIRASILGGLLMLFSPWLVLYGRISWEMALNVFFLTAATTCLYFLFTTSKLRWSFWVGFFLGLTVNGHIYIISQAIPFGLGILANRVPIRHKIYQVLLATCGGFIALVPLGLATIQNDWDLFTGYGGSGATTAARGLTMYALRVVGSVATLNAVLATAVSIAFLAAVIWGAQRIWRYRDPFALFLVSAVVLPLFILPIVVGASDNPTYDEGWCGFVSAHLLNHRCVATIERYFDVMMPLPFLLVAWWGATSTRKSVSAFIVLSAVLIAPQLPTAVELITRVDPWRVDRLTAVINDLPSDACVIASVPNRDYRRLWVLAGDRPVYYNHEYHQLLASDSPPDCSRRFLISAFFPFDQEELDLQHIVSAHGYDLWFVYELRARDLSDCCSDDRSPEHLETVVTNHPLQWY